MSEHPTPEPEPEPAPAPSTRSFPVPAPPPRPGPPLPRPPAPTPAAPVGIVEPAASDADSADPEAEVAAPEVEGPGPDVVADPPDHSAFGRVDNDGTVFVRDGDTEREVGSYPGAAADEALAYFGRKYTDLSAQVSLLEQRSRAGKVTGKEIDQEIARLRDATTGALVVGDLPALSARLDALEVRAAKRRAQAEAGRARAREKALAERTAMVEEAERIAATDAAAMQWKTASDRMRDLFADWKTAQRESRVERAEEDALWKRFSHARNTFDRTRRAWFSHLEEAHGEVRARKREIVTEAEQLAASTDWASTSTAYRTLMDRWKAAGRGSKKDDDALWNRFRRAQDAFFAARSAANAAEDEEFRANLTVKEALAEQAEALLPVRDLAGAKAALRSIQERWEGAGKVPRADMARIDARLKAVEQALRDADSDRWRRSNPESRARAGSMVEQLQNAIATLEHDVESARDRGDVRAERRASQELAARRTWLDTALRAMADAER